MILNAFSPSFLIGQFLLEVLDVGWLGFYGISTFVGCLKPNPFLYK